MIALSVPRFAHCDFGLHDRIAFSLDIDVRETPAQSIELRCVYSELECEQLLESTVLEHIDTSGLYRLRLAVDPPSLSGRRDGILFVRALYSGRQFYQAGFFVHSGRRTRSVLASSPYVTHDHSVWHQ